jgi:SNF2 family DNA or RNA helicase
MDTFQLMSHQKRFVELCGIHKRFAWFAEPGCGKTIAMLSAIRSFADPAKDRVLVLCPRSVIRTAWIGDSERVGVRLDAVVEGGKVRSVLDSGSPVVVTSFDLFRIHFDHFVRAGFSWLVVDEASKLKSRDSAISRKAFEFSGCVDRCYLLTGTPAPNSEIEYFALMRCVDPRLLGTNFFRFARRFFDPIYVWAPGGRRCISGWKIREKDKPLLASILARKSWYLKKTECLDLPPQTDVVREVSLGQAEADAYRKTLAELDSCFDGAALNVTTINKFTKLRQITGGSVIGEDEEGVRRSVRIGDSKIRELESLMSEIGDSPVVIWAEFRDEIRRIAEKLSGSGYRVGRLFGEEPQSSRDRSVELFQSGGMDVLVCHPASAGHGLTLTAASHAIYYSHGFSYELFQQSRDRIYRVGQKNPVTYFHLVVPGTVDVRAYKACRRKSESHSAMLEAIRECVKLCK